MGKVTKLIAAVTALLVALVGTVSMTIGKGPEPAAGITIVLDSPAAFKAFLDNHPSNG